MGTFWRDLCTRAHYIWTWYLQLSTLIAIECRSPFSLQLYKISISLPCPFDCWNKGLGRKLSCNQDTCLMAFSLLPCKRRRSSFPGFFITFRFEYLHFFARSQIYLHHLTHYGQRTPLLWSLQVSNRTICRINMFWTILFLSLCSENLEQSLLQGLDPILFALIYRFCTEINRKNLCYIFLKTRILKLEIVQIQQKKDILEELKV